jgi:hypothetical protein
MTKRFAVLILSAVAMSGVRTLALASSATAATHDTAPAPPSQPSSTTLMLRGTIEKYDASTRILSLSASSGIVQFPVPTTVRIHKGWHRLDAAVLEKMSGFRAAVRYSQSGGEKILESIHVFDK